MKRWRFTIFLLLLVAGGLLVNAWAYLGEAHVVRGSPLGPVLGNVERDPPGLDGL